MALSAKVNCMLENIVLEVINNHSGFLQLSSQDGEGHWQLETVIDFFLLNKFALQEQCKMETTHSVLDFIKGSNAMLSVALEVMSFMAPVHQYSKEYLLCLQCKCLPAPRPMLWISSSLTGVHASILTGADFGTIARCSIHLLCYLHSWLVLVFSEAQVLQNRDCFLAFYCDLAVLVKGRSQSSCSSSGQSTWACG